LYKSKSTKYRIDKANSIRFGEIR